MVIRSLSLTFTGAEVLSLGPGFCRGSWLRGREAGLRGHHLEKACKPVEGGLGPTSGAFESSPQVWVSAAGDHLGEPDLLPRDALPHDQPGPRAKQEAGPCPPGAPS